MRCSHSKARTIAAHRPSRRGPGKIPRYRGRKNLLAGYKHATNIVRIEEKKDARQYVGKPDPSLYRQDEEWALSKAIDTAKEEAVNAVAKEDFAATMRAMAELRPHVDAFFDKVTVNGGARQPWGLAAPSGKAAGLGAAERVAMLKNPLQRSEDWLCCVLEALTPNRLSLTIAIDGADGCGKSSLASWLAWQVEAATPPYARRPCMGWRLISDMAGSDSSRPASRHG